MVLRANAPSSFARDMSPPYPAFRMLPPTRTLRHAYPNYSNIHLYVDQPLSSDHAYLDKVMKRCRVPSNRLSAHLTRRAAAFAEQWQALVVAA